MPGEPSVKRVSVFVDGQNLYHGAKEAFGYTHPNYDVMALAKMVCGTQAGWSLSAVHFYTGFPKAEDDRFWNNYWAKKMSFMGRQGVRIFNRPLRYREQKIRLSDHSVVLAVVGQEKGVDVRIAVDIIRGALKEQFDVALVFSQDQDLSEVAIELGVIALQQKRWMRMASAFPVGPGTNNLRGIDKTDWLKIDRAQYDGCLDPNDYRA